MSNLASLLKDEITRLCRKEIKVQTAALKTASSAHRSDIAALKRRIASLEREMGKAGGTKTHPITSTRPVRSAKGRSAPRFVAKGLVALRKRLGVTVEELAQLLDVSPQSIYNWQAKKSVPPKAQLEKLVAVRALTKREARALLSAM